MEKENITIPADFSQILESRTLDLKGEDIFKMMMFIMKGTMDITPKSPEDMMSLEEFALLVHRSERQIIRDLEAGEYKDCSRKFGKQWMFNRKAIMHPTNLERWFAEKYQ